MTSEALASAQQLRYTGFVKFGFGANHRDVYANLLSDTRGLPHERARARDHWFAALPWDAKEADLFELEMLLKGLVCFGNPRNQAGPIRKTPGIAHDFKSELRTLRDGLERIGKTLRRLLGKRDQAFTFFRYLESVIPEDLARSRLVSDQLVQDTPDDSLFLLRNTFNGFLEIADGLMRLNRVSNKAFYALHGNITREIERNAFFNPLITLEFRPEFDRIRNPDVLEALDSVESEAAHRVVTLTFLTLFRALRYVDLIEKYASDAKLSRLGFLLFAALRSDLRALSQYLAKRGPSTVADGFETELLRVSADNIKEHYSELNSIAQSLLGARSALVNVANLLRIEIRKIAERDLPAPYSTTRTVQLQPSFIVAVAEIRAALHHAINTMCLYLQPSKSLPELVQDESSQRAASERLRRDVWMFAQIVRAFLAKANAADSHADGWVSYASFQLVREFVRHFRAIGYQLIRMNDYERIEPFLSALEQAQERDLLQPQRLHHLIEECKVFYEFLNLFFQRISERRELAHLPFDKKVAAETLKMYLGAV